MNRILHCLLFMITLVPLTHSFLSTASAQNNETLKANESVEGWRAAKWGMTEEQILEAFKGEAKKLEKEQKWRSGGAIAGVATVGIERVDIANKPFEVLFILESETRRLKQVAIRSPKTELFPELTFPNVEKLLVEKYGQPTFSNNENDRLTVKKVRSWKKDKTRIQLEYTEFKDLKFKNLVISYEAISKGSGDNL